MFCDFVVELDELGGVVGVEVVDCFFVVMVLEQLVDCECWVYEDQMVQFVEILFVEKEVVEDIKLFDDFGWEFWCVDVCVLGGD